MESVSPRPLSQIASLLGTSLVAASHKLIAQKPIGHHGPHRLHTYEVSLVADVGACCRGSQHSVSVFLWERLSWVDVPLGNKQTGRPGATSQALRGTELSLTVKVSKPLC